MSQPDHSKGSPPRKTLPPRQLLLVGIIALIAAGGIAANGLIGRARNQKDLVQWTNAQAVPTVMLAKLQRGAAEQKLILPGNIRPFSKATIYARVSGYVKSWNTDIGAHVKANDVLATIEAPDLDQQLAQAKATLASAKANYDIAVITAERNTVLVQRQAVAQQIADQTNADAQAKKAVMDADQAYVGQLEAMQSFKRLVAPFDGIVTARNTDVGALINSGSAGQPLFEVADLHRVRIYVQVPQAFTADLHPGLKATFEMPQYPGQQFNATLVTTSNQMIEASRSMQVELQADNSDGKLFGGTYCRVDFQIPSDPNVLRLPATALMLSNRGSQVAIVDDNNKVVLKSIQLGRDFGDTVEVTAGLSPQDKVIDSPSETLQAGDTVQVAPPPPPAPATQAATPASSATP
jgi:RND family efflux transporter MFP subunit